jgi:NDP-sugar pyrophosphorylase family protein
MKAMILAAGLGTRMGPLAADRAKPTLPVLDAPVVLALVRTLAGQGVRGIVVNTHAHPETMKEALRNPPLPVSFSHEPVLLGTGGAIRAARRWLDGDEPFLVLNGDMVLDLDAPALLEAHRARGAVATLLLRDDSRKARFGTLGFDDRGRVTRVTDLIAVASEEGCGLFAGVHVVEPQIYDQMPDKAAFDILQDVYVPALQRGERIGALLHPPEARWWPIGSPGDLLRANLLALSDRLGDERGADAAVHVAADAEVGGEVVGPSWVGPRAEVERGARIGPWVVVEADARLEAGVLLEQVVVLSKARVQSGTALRGAVVGPMGASRCD